MHSNSQRMMIRGVFFDLFGTLFIYGDMKKAWRDWLSHFHSSMSDCGLSISKDDFSKACNQFFGKDEPVLKDENMTVFEKRIKALCTKLNLNVSKDNIRNIANQIVEKWQEQIHLDSDAISTIRKLKKDKIIGLVSNFDHPPHVRRYLSKHKLDTLFDTIIISSEVGVKKPDPRIFIPALMETGLDAGEIVYVGDTEADIVAAKAANMKPILIQRKEKGTDKNALDFSIEQKREVSPVVTDVSIISSLPELITMIG